MVRRDLANEAMELTSLVGLRKRGNELTSLVGLRPVVLPDETRRCKTFVGCGCGCAFGSELGLHGLRRLHGFRPVGRCLAWKSPVPLRASACWESG